jgi:hypothetical protein
MLFSEDFLHLADFLSDFPADLFGLAFGLQIWTVRRLSDLLFDFTPRLLLDAALLECRTFSFSNAADEPRKS